MGEGRTGRVWAWQLALAGMCLGTDTAAACLWELIIRPPLFGVRVGHSTSFPAPWRWWVGCRLHCAWKQHPSCSPHHPMFGQAALVASLQQHVVPLLGGPSGVRPVMDSQFELEEVAKAHSRLESRQHFGKTVLRVGGDGV